MKGKKRLKIKPNLTLKITNLNSTSDDQESSVETIGKKVSEEPARQGTARVWTSSGSTSSSKMIGGGAEEAGKTGTGAGAEEGPATGKAEATGAAEATETAGNPKASLTWDKKSGS